MSILRRSAKYRQCQVRIPSVCNRDSETVVLAHVGKSHMGGKCHDLLATFACSSCHDVMDGRVPSGYSKDEVALMAREGVERTQIIWLREGFITIGR